ncbi:hypothetical protein Tsubulata_036166 [Turnera subulata]|uniref:Homeobox domain-containing protein n=1 Tax=Turnera subulata TaxID=218843 RepID=A0A9Q0F5X0_9ROSI|nr:hypothetical protein Tsubulata_036166 [Turnera subulata]
MREFSSLSLAFIAISVMEAGFTLDEVVELRRIYMEMGEESLSPVFCQQLAKCFNLDSEHAKKPITWQLVQNWFKQKQETLRLPFGASPLFQATYQKAQRSRKGINKRVYSYSKPICYD